MDFPEKKPPQIDLNDKLRSAINDYINQKGYAVWTVRKYRAGIDKLFQKYDYLDKKRCKQIMNKPNPNQKALLNLILMAASEADIELPSIKVSGKMDKGRALPNIRYTIEQVKNMIECLPGRRDKLLFRCIFSIGAGLRISEVINMRWEDFNWSRWITRQEESGEFMIKNTKRNKTFAVPVPSEIMKDLFNYASENRVNIEMQFMGEGIGFKKVPKSKDHVFKFDITKVDDNGFMKNVEPDEWDFQYVQKIYNHIQFHVLHKHISGYLGHRLKLHALRHARATQLINEGVDISIVSKLLGHKNLSTTMIYLDMTTLEQAKAIKGIPIA